MTEERRRSTVPSGTEPGVPTPPAGPERRARRRLARTQSFVQAARAIVHEEGLDALTMARLADELGCGVGTVYGYFPSKGALVAEVQRQAIERLTASYLASRVRTDSLLAEVGAVPTQAALARLLAFGRFWVASTDAFPQELRLLEVVMTTPEVVMTVDESALVVPAALRLVGHLHTCLDAAADLGALHPGDGFERAVVWAAAVNGVLLLRHLESHDRDIFDGRRLADGLHADLLAGWGAQRDELRGASRLIDALAATGPLAPPVREPDERS